MRKKNPTDICDQFIKEMDSFIKFRKELVGCAVSDGNQSLLAALVFHRAYVSLESFLSAWFLAAINRDPSQFFQQRESKIRNLVKTEISHWDDTKISYSPPKHIKVDDLTPLIDPNERNLNFYDHADMKEKASRWLITSYSNKINAINFPLPRIYRATKTIRNCIAHQSQSSFDTMNATLKALPNTGVCVHLRKDIRAVSDVGAHLKSVFGGKTRTDIYIEQFKKIASKLK